MIYMASAKDSLTRIWVKIGTDEKLLLASESNLEVSSEEPEPSDK